MDLNALLSGGLKLTVIALTLTSLLRTRAILRAPKGATVR